MEILTGRRSIPVIITNKGTHGLRNEPYILPQKLYSGFDRASGDTLKGLSNGHI